MRNKILGPLPSHVYLRSRFFLISMPECKTLIELCGRFYFQKCLIFHDFLTTWCWHASLCDGGCSLFLDLGRLFNCFNPSNVAEAMHVWLLRLGNKSLYNFHLALSWDTYLVSGKTYIDTMSEWPSQQPTTRHVNEYSFRHVHPSLLMSSSGDSRNYGAEKSHPCYAVWIPDPQKLQEINSDYCC